MKCKCGYDGPPANDIFKEAVHVDTKRGGVYLDIYVAFCPECGEVEDSGTWVEK